METTPSNDPCDDPLELPTIPEFIQSLGAWSYVLYAAGISNTLLQGFLFLYLLRQFIRTLESKRLVSSIWVTSIFFVISVFNMISLVLPQANDFLWLAYKIFVGIAMGHFVDLTLGWYGGESAMLQHVGENTPLSFRKAPCCCCLLLPRQSLLTKNKIRIMRGSVYQIPYTESLCLILLISLQMSGYVEEGGLSLASPNTYITALVSITFVFGLWGLFMFFNITHKLDLLKNYNYKKKSNLMRITIVIINFQTLIIDICNRQGWISCIPETLSASGVTCLIKVVCVLIESFILGTVSFLVYKDEGTYI